MLFGTDVILEPGCVDEYLLQHLVNHIRFIHQLRLSDGVLQAVTRTNAERLLKLEPLPTQRRGRCARDWFGYTAARAAWR